MRKTLVQPSRKYVDVVARWDADGSVEPLIVCWPDGRSFQIEEIVGMPQSNTFPGNAGRTLRYTIVIDQVLTHLFLEMQAGQSEESTRWYVERRPGSLPWDPKLSAHVNFATSRKDRVGVRSNHPQRSRNRRQ